MTGLLDDVQREVQNEPRSPSRVRQVFRPTLAMIVAIALATLSWVAVASGWSPAVTILLTVACALAIAAAGIAAMIWKSAVVAPLAVCILAVGNPLAAQALNTFAEREVGPVSVADDRGLVFWELYPGVAGWASPEPLPSVDTTSLARTAQAQVRGVVEELTDSFGYAWIVEPDARSGVSAIPNGFGGTSMLVRVDVPQWVAEDFNGSQPERDAILGAAAAAAAELQLTDVADPLGDIGTGDGVRTWAAPGELLSLSFDGPRVSLAFTAGPFLSDKYVPDEYERALRSFDGLMPPETREEPAFPPVP